MTAPRVLVLTAICIGLLGRGAAAAQPRAPGAPAITFNRHIAPILFQHCAPCHRPDQVAPFSLTSYEDAARHATQIAEATKRRYMPPWKPEPGYGEFEGVRRLTADQIDLIQRWVAGGRVRGNAAGLPPLPAAASGWRLGTPDVVLTLSDAYVLEPDGRDVFRTFVVPIPKTERRYVRALDFHPGAPRAVHHANLKIDATRSSRWFDEQEPGPGYEGAGARGAQFPDGHFLGWTPGQSPRVAPEGLSWRLEPSSDLIIELHMTPTGRRELVQPRVALYFTDKPPERRPYMLRLGRQDIDIPAGASRYVSTDTYVLPVDVDIVAVQPHAHGLAKEVRGYATLPDGTTKWLVFIREWDTKWQDVYRFRDPVPAPRGTRLTMEYAYDNSEGNVRNPYNPPRRVTFGQTSSSEMGDLWLQVMPRSAEERRALEQDFAPKMLREDIAGLQKMLEIEPDDPRLHADLGFCYIEAGRTADALAHLERAARLDPSSAGAQYDAGTLLLKLRSFGRARDYLARAAALKPDFAEALNNLGVASHAEGKLDEALEWYTRALAIDRQNADALYNKGRALAARGDNDAALEHYRRALDLKPDDAVTHASIASLLASRQEIDRAIVHYRRALQADPDLPAALVDLAWILATSDRPGVQAPEEAVRLAERASQVTGGSSPTVLDTLAAAYAASGQLGPAVATAEEALALAAKEGSADLAERIRMRVDVYRQAAATERR